jgi:RNA polymerase sigma-70 factor (ECF subfamily)
MISNPYLLLANEPNIGLENIIEGILNQEENALEALYELTLSRVYGLAVKITNNKELAEEVVVDTYWQVWKDAQNYNRHKGPLIAWVLVICRSRAIDAIRTNASHFDVNTEACDWCEELEFHAEITLEPQNQLQQSQNNIVLHQYMNALSATQKQLIYLGYFKGLSHEEIATHMLMPLGTVKSNIKRAQATLKKQLIEPDRI